MKPKKYLNREKLDKNCNKKVTKVFDECKEKI